MPYFQGLASNFAVLGTIAMIIFSFVSYGWMIGILSLPIGLVVFLIVGQIIHRRVRRKTRQYALSSAYNFSAMWEAGVISVKDSQSGQTAICYRGDELHEFLRTVLEENSDLK